MRRAIYNSTNSQNTPILHDSTVLFLPAYTFIIRPLSDSPCTHAPLPLPSQYCAGAVWPASRSLDPVLPGRRLWHVPGLHCLPAQLLRHVLLHAGHWRLA